MRADRTHWWYSQERPSRVVMHDWCISCGEFKEANITDLHLPEEDS